MLPIRFIVAAACLSAILSVASAFSFRTCGITSTQRMSGDLQMHSETSRPFAREISKVLASSIASATLMGASVAPVVTPLLAQTAFVQPAYADVRAQQKRTYFRFVPKLITGRDYFKNELKTAVDNEDWSVVSKFFEVYVSKYNADDPNQVDATDSYVNLNFYRPMVVFAGSFAEKGQSPKQRALMEYKDKFTAAMGELEGCVKDRKGEGFFAADIKMPTGEARTEQAKKAWAAGKEALNGYIATANDGLMLELNKIDTI